MDLQPNVRASYFNAQCLLTNNPCCTPQTRPRIAFVCSLLTGRALDWVTAVWREDRPTFPSFRAFIQRFKEVFEHPAGGGEAGEQLLTLRQGRSSAADYALSFRTLAAQTGWTDDPLRLHYRTGLNTELQSELTCRDKGKSLEQFIELFHQDRQSPSLLVATNRLPASLITPSTANPEIEPMQIWLDTHQRGGKRETHSTELMLVLRITWASKSILSHSSIS